MIKTVGMLLILGSCTLMGLMFAQKKRCRRDDLVNMTRALVLLKTQICFLAMPLPEAMSDIADKTGGGIGDLFKRAGEIMHQRQGHGAQEIWQQAIEQSKGRLFFSKEDIQMLLAFGKTLGYLDASLQKESIAILTSYLTTQENELRTRLGKHQQLCLSVGVISGLLFIIALI